MRKSINEKDLLQTYARIAKHLVRDDVILLAIFRQDDMNLTHIYSDHVYTDMSFQKLKDLCSKCWKDGEY